MESEAEISKPVKVFFFPYMAHGHLIPTLDMAKLFAAKGASATIITTPKNLSYFLSQKDSDVNIEIKLLTFPATEAGLPEGFENLNLLKSSSSSSSLASEMFIKFFKAATLMQPQLELLLEKERPDCLVADMFFPWATESCAKFGIPRMVFHGTSFFSLCTTECIRAYEPYKNVSSDIEPFTVTNLPGDIKLTRSQLSSPVEEEEESDMHQQMRESGDSVKNSYRVIVNSFYELESVYADFYRNELKRRSWHVGPVSLCNRGVEEKADRGMKSSVDQHECLKWLDSKKPNSVIYVCFGSVANFPDSQLMEIAKGLQASGQDFIWVVRKDEKGTEEGKDEWLPEEFEERVKGKGLIIRGWAPQVLLLEHQAIGGFVTHCGWNSTLEGISAGVPMVTWPIAAEQFYNEKLVTQVLKIGVSIGAQNWALMVGDFITSDKVEKTVREVMVGDEAEERRKRAQELGEMARKAVEKGGSSYNDLEALIEELRSHRCGKQNDGK